MNVRSTDTESCSWNCCLFLMDLLENIRRNQDRIQRTLQQYPTIVPNNGLTVNKRDFILSVSMIQRVVRNKGGGGGGQEGGGGGSF